MTSTETSQPNAEEIKERLGSMALRYLWGKVKAFFIGIVVLILGYCSVGALLSDSIEDSGAFARAAEHYRQANGLGPDVEIEFCGRCNSSMSSRGAVTTWKFVMHAELEQGTRRIDVTAVHDEDSGRWDVSY